MGARWASNIGCSWWVWLTGSGPSPSLGVGLEARRATVRLTSNERFWATYGGLMPDRAAARVVLVGDSEFGSLAVIEQLEEWGFYYVVRQKGSHLVCCSEWQP